MLCKRSAAVLLVLSLTLPACESLTGPRPPVGSWSRVELDVRVTDAYTGFGFELFRRLRAAQPDANVFASPTSAALALAMTYNGAVGETADQMAHALGVAQVDVETLNANARLWVDALRETGDRRAELAVANSIWYREWHPLREDFVERARDAYDAELRPISTPAAINGWVRDATRGRIDQLVDQIPGDVVAYLINALYFKADWRYPFDVSRTREAPFRRPDGSTVTVPMMWRDGGYESRSDAEMTMVRLAYGSGRFSMVIALPHPPHDLARLADRLDPGTWRDWMADFRDADGLPLGLPRFEIEWESSLVDSLQAMGMEVPFEPGLADFSGMFQRGGPWIDEVLQKTYLRVDEKGTEAAAVTKVVMRETAFAGITFDRPFLLAIYDHATETVLFLGQVVDPTA